MWFSVTHAISHIAYTITVAYNRITIAVKGVFNAKYSHDLKFLSDSG